MTSNIYAIRDTKAETILGGLHIFKHQAVAIRFFGDLAADPQTNVCRHIADHELVVLGSFDEDSTLIVGFVAPHVIITGTAWKAAQAEGPSLV